MKITNSFLAGLLLIGSLGATATAMAADDGILLKQELTPGNYCHEKFRAMRPSTLGTDHPTLKSSTTGDVIDFYGSCDESPTGKDQLWQQKLSVFLAKRTIGVSSVEPARRGSTSLCLPRHYFAGADWQHADLPCDERLHCELLRNKRSLLTSRFPTSESDPSD